MRILTNRRTILLMAVIAVYLFFGLAFGTTAEVAGDSAVAEAAALRANILVAPPLWFGWSPHHLVLPGTITIRAEGLIEGVFDIELFTNQ